MSGSHLDTSNMKGILTDVTKCIGCEMCVEACSRINKMPKDVPFSSDWGDGLSGRRLTSIVRAPGTDRTVRRQCLHCIDPACVSACLVGAFKKRADGAVEYDASMCIGCRYCMLACPFEIPRYEWEKPLPYVIKCKMNEECRVEGGMPACVSACPTGATIFGKRDELIHEAKRRIKEKPELYIPHVYGEHEFGGTSVMYVSDIPIEDIVKFPREKELDNRSLAALKEGSIPKLVSPWVSFTPIQAGVVMGGLALTWFIRRRERLMSGSEPHDRGTHGAPEPDTAGIDEVCQAEPSLITDDKEGK